MLKRIFWLSVIAVGAWLVWQWFRQRQDEFSDTAPQFAPPRPYTPPAATTSAPPAPPAAAVTSPAPEPLAPEPPAATSAAALDALFADEPAQPAPGAAEVPAADATPAEGEEIIGYCMRCRTKRPIKDPHEETTESGRRAARGTCPVCGTNMFIFLAAHDEADGEGAAQ